MWTLSGFADEIDGDLTRQCEVLTELGISQLELRSAWCTNVCDLRDDQLTEAGDILATRGISMSSVGSPIGKIGVDEDFVADAFHAPYLRLFSFYPSQGGADHRDEVMRRLSACAVEAEPFDVPLLHENAKGIYGDVPARCLDIVETVGRENPKLTWDAANFVQVGDRPVTEGYALLWPLVAYIEIKDALLSDRSVVPAGQGDGQLRETIAALAADGFDAFFSMEPHLAAVGKLGGFSGPELFGPATRAFTELLDEASIPYV